MPDMWCTDSMQGAGWRITGFVLLQALQACLHTGRGNRRHLRIGRAALMPDNHGKFSAERFRKDMPPLCSGRLKNGARNGVGRYFQTRAAFCSGGSRAEKSNACAHGSNISALFLERIKKRLKTRNFTSAT